MMYQRGRSIPATQYVDAVAAVQAATRAAARFHLDHDLLLSPTLATTPPPHGAFVDAAEPMRGLVAAGRFSPFTAVMNITGQPSISLPLAHGPDGLPIGVMLSAALGEEVGVRVVHLHSAASSSATATASRSSSPWSWISR